MDVYSNNRTKLNTDRIKRIDDKIIVFAETIPVLGEGFFEFPFPLKGKIKQAQSACKYPSDADMSLKVQKCARDLYGTAGETWEDVFSEPIRINANEKDSNIVNTPNSNQHSVNNGDYFRTFVTSIGTGMQNLVTQVMIEVVTEE